jgi:ring-1,2-phenylacetyl-CoA epoxidase subunit PaaE
VTLVLSLLIISNACDARMLDFHQLVIAAVKRETPAAISVTFTVPPSASRAFHFEPGQHLTVRALLDGEEMRRTYSICSGPDDVDLSIAIKRVVGGRFSNWANDTWQAGDRLEVMAPAGRFVLRSGDEAPRHVLLFAAGVGITPIIAIARHALARTSDTQVTLVYGNQRVEMILFRQQLEDLKDRYVDRFSLIHVLSRSDELEAPICQGRIDGDKVKALCDKLIDDRTHAFVCGPGSMIKDTRNALFAVGLPPARVHHEFFVTAGGAYRAPTPAAVSVAPTEAECTKGGSEVVAVLDGMRHRFVVPNGGHVVDAALAAGVRVPYSCKGGMCCTCRAKLIEGVADMSINFSLEPWEIEKGFILTCQAVPKSERLVVDYDQM